MSSILHNLSAAAQPVRKGPSRIPDANTAVVDPARARPQTAAAGLLMLPAVTAERGPAPIRRLLVLVPEVVMVEAELAQRAWALASPAKLAVVFVGLAPEAENEPFVRRQLAGLAALTRDEGVPVSTRLSRVPDWLSVVRLLWQPGDLVVCFPGQAGARGRLGLRRRELQHDLLERLRVPVYLAGLVDRPVDLRQPMAGMLSGLLSFLAPLALIAGFFWMQVRVGQVASGVGATFLLCLCVGGEFALLWVLEKFLDRV